MKSTFNILKHYNYTEKYFSGFFLLSLLTLLTTLLSGCMGQTTIPEDHYYRLPEISPDKKLSEPAIKGTLGVELFQLNGIPNTRAMLYVDTSHPNEIKKYYYRHWVEGPENLINAHLITFLKKSGIAADVIQKNDTTTQEITIRGRILRFERVMGKNGPKIIVKLSMNIDTNQPKNLGKTKNYQASIPTKNTSMDETVAAFNDALKIIYQDLISDILTDSK